MTKISNIPILNTYIDFKLNIKNMIRYIIQNLNFVNIYIIEIKKQIVNTNHNTIKNIRNIN